MHSDMQHTGNYKGGSLSFSDLRTQLEEQRKRLDALRGYL
jgi:hypothetical protein